MSAPDTPGIAALMLALGVEESDFPAMWEQLGPMEIPLAPLEAVEQFRSVHSAIVGADDESACWADTEGFPPCTCVDCRKEPVMPPPASMWGGSNLERLIDQAPAGLEIAGACFDLMVMLLKKNIAYGNSALEPMRVFSGADGGEQLLVRIDDKLSRLANKQSFPGDDDIDDLLGYLILLKVQRGQS